MYRFTVVIHLKTIKRVSIFKLKYDLLIIYLDAKSPHIYFKVLIIHQCVFLFKYSIKITK